MSLQVAPVSGSSTRSQYLARLEKGIHTDAGDGGKELSGFLERLHLGIALADILGRYILPVGIARFKGRENLFPGMRFKHPDDVVGDLVHHVNGTGAHIQHNVVAAELILMNHLRFSFKQVKMARKNAARQAAERSTL